MKRLVNSGLGDIDAECVTMMDIYYDHSNSLFFDESELVQIFRTLIDKSNTDEAVRECFCNLLAQFIDNGSGADVVASCEADGQRRHGTIERSGRRNRKRIGRQ